MRKLSYAVGDTWRGSRIVGVCVDSDDPAGQWRTSPSRGRDSIVTARGDHDKFRIRSGYLFPTRGYSGLPRATQHVNAAGEGCHFRQPMTRHERRVCPLCYEDSWRFEIANHRCCLRNPVAHLCGHVVSALRDAEGRRDCANRIDDFLNGAWIEREHVSVGRIKAAHFCAGHSTDATEILGNDQIGASSARSDSSIT